MTSVNRIFMLDSSYLPVAAPVTWTGRAPIPTDGTPVAIDVRAFDPPFLLP